MPENAAPARQLRIHVAANLPGMTARVARALPEHLISSSLAPEARAALLRASPGVDDGALAAIAERMRPMPLIVQRDVEMDAGIDVALILGGRAPLADTRVEVVADSPAIAERVIAELAALGFEPRARLAHVDRPGVRFGGAAELVRAVLRWSLAGAGHDLAEEASLGLLDDRVVVAVRDPALEGRSAAERYAVIVETDDELAVAPLVESLREDGLQVRIVEARGDARSTFAMDLGGFADAAGGALGKRLVARVEEALLGLGFDLQEDPLGVDRARDGILDARVRLPIAAVRARPRATFRGPRPGRFDLVLRTDDPDVARTLAGLLESEGLRVSGVEALPAGALAPRVTWPARFAAPLLEAACGSTLREALARAGLGAERGIERRRSGATDLPRVVIDIPVAALSSPAVERRLHAAVRKTPLRILHARGVDVERVEAALRDEGFEVFERARLATVEEASVAFGGASDVVCALAMRALSGLGLAEVGAEQRWVAEDGDVWVHVPFDPCVALAGEAPVSGYDAAEPGLVASLVESVIHAAPFLERTEQGMTRVGERALPDASVRDARDAGDARDAPDEADAIRPGRGAPFVLDSASAQILAAIADAFADGEPLLLHGPPGTGRRTALRELARWTGARIQRVRLHADTTASDLLGRWIGPGAGRGRWRDGAAVRAALQGCWLHLDGIDRANPRVVDAFIALLDGPDGAHRPDAPEDVPVVAERCFRVVATATELPPEASAPWVDRFRRVAIGALDEAGATELVVGLAGRSPACVVVGGDSWTGLPVAPTFARLAHAQDLDLVAATIARVHAGAVAAAGPASWQGGARPSRRAITHVLTQLERLGHDAASLRRALVAAYLQGAPSRAVADLIEAAVPRVAVSA